MEVTRRDGTKQELNKSKVQAALKAAFISCNYDLDDLDARTKQLSDSISYWDNINVETIQDQIIEVLRDYEYDDVADAYLMYRAQKEEARRYIEENVEYMLQYINSSDNAATASATDANANVTVKNVSNLESEVPKVKNRLIQRAWMKRALNELFPDLTKQYEADLNHHIIYTHDEASTSTIKNYCEAVSLYPLAVDGTSTIDGTGTKAPKHLSSFAGQLCNLLFLLSSQCKGACLYKDQRLLINDKEIKIKDFVSSLLRVPKSFIDDEGNYWEYSTVEEDYSIEEDGKLAQITKVFRRPYSDKIYKISSNKGFTATVSKNHKFKVLRQGQIVEVEAKDLQLFDTVFVNNEYDQLIDFNSLDFKRGFIHGMLLGDGNLTQFPIVGLSVNYNQEYYADIFNSYSEELYGSTLSKCSGHNCWNYQKKAPEYYQEITKGIVGNNTFDKHIDQIEDKNINYLVGLLDGLLSADGGKNHSIVLALVNKTLILQIEKILKLLRINYSYTEIPEHDNKSRLYQLCISSTVTRYTPHFISKFTKPNKNRETYYFSGNSRKNERRNPNYILSTTKDHFIYKDYKLDVITSIETFDNDDDFVYEIETSTHWYNCGGFITHNCAFGEFFNFFDYYAAKDFGENYHEKADMYADSDVVKHRKTIGEKIDQAFQQIVYYWNQPAGNRGSQSPFSNISYYDKNYWKALFEDFYFPDGTQPVWERVDWLQKRFMKWFNNERSKTLLTFPVETVALLTDGKDVLDKDYKNFVAEMWSKGHSFFLYLSDNPDSLASCCRLRNKIQQNVFSFTNGLSGVQTGSCNVITLNLNRIIQDWYSLDEPLDGVQYSIQGKIHDPKDRLNSMWITKKEAYISLRAYLRKIVERVQKYHIAFKHNLYMFEKAGQLTASSAGYISMKKLYSTIGLNGINEAAMFLGIPVSYNEEYKKFCQLITGTISELNKKNSTPEYMFNQEFVPAESLGSKNFNWDREDGYIVPDDGRVLYNSYFYDAHDDTSVIDKLKMHGREFTESLDGSLLAAC